MSFCNEFIEINFQVTKRYSVNASLLKPSPAAQSSSYSLQSPYFDTNSSNGYSSDIYEPITGGKRGGKRARGGYNKGGAKRYYY